MFKTTTIVQFLGFEFLRMISWRGIPHRVDDLSNTICIYNVCVYWPWMIRLQPYISSAGCRTALTLVTHRGTGPPTVSLSFGTAGSHRFDKAQRSVTDSPSIFGTDTVSKHGLRYPTIFRLNYRYLEHRLDMFSLLSSECNERLSRLIFLAYLKYIVFINTENTSTKFYFK